MWGQNDFRWRERILNRSFSLFLITTASTQLQGLPKTSPQLIARKQRLIAWIRRPTARLFTLERSGLGQLLWHNVILICQYIPGLSAFSILKNATLCFLQIYVSVYPPKVTVRAIYGNMQHWTAVETSVTATPRPPEVTKVQQISLTGPLIIMLF